MPSSTRLQDCIDHHDEYVLVLAGMPDRRLREKLDTIHLQMALAERQRDTTAIELLEVWRAQTIEARTYKAENNIPDAANDIADTIAEIETYIAPEIVQDSEPTLPIHIQHKTRVIEDNSEQLSFF